jgi:hypothetical protein
VQPQVGYLCGGCRAVWVIHHGYPLGLHTGACEEVREHEFTAPCFSHLSGLFLTHLNEWLSSTKITYIVSSRYIMIIPSDIE